MKSEEPSEDAAFELAQFPISLNLPSGPESLVTDAKQAVRREYRDSTKWKRLRCRKVEILAKSERGTIFVLEIGHAVELDWSWEGAIAFRPLVMDDQAEKQPLFNDQQDDPEIDDSILWQGEIVEVDEAGGRIFVCVVDPEHPPRKGSFFVRPYEFLACLNAVFNEPSFDKVRSLLPSRLLATQGGIHPNASDYSEVGLPTLRDWWRRSWCVLWGPPGTGKTYTTGQQVAQALADPSERILVVSTTNKATDAAALAIGRAAKAFALHELSDSKLLRIGKGATLHQFQAEGLLSMLRGTETEYLADIDRLAEELARSDRSEDKAIIREQIRQLRLEMSDSGYRNFLDRDNRVVVSTAFRATTFLRAEEVKEGIESGLGPFTTVFIDEAGLISRAAAVALSLLASRRVVLVGDSKQLAPISRISRILPTNQMTWLANSGLSHLQHITANETGVHVLTEQRRMHDDICTVVSRYQYDGRLTTAAEVSQRNYVLPAVLRDQPRAIWYVLDDDGQDLHSIRADRGPGNRSWIRLATSKVLAKLFGDPQFQAAKGLFISPYKAQATQVAALFAKNRLSSWSASTVHSQQGSEADIVIFDSVNAGSYSWPFDEWKRLINVALSRSRESVMVLASRAEMEEPYLRPLLSELAPQVLRTRGQRVIWEEVAAKADYVPPNGVSALNPNSLGSQLLKRKELRPVLSNEQERLCRLELDGKPRLVRGVAGSGKTAVLAHWLMQTLKQFSNQPDVRIWAVYANRSLQSLIADSIASAWENEGGGAAFPAQQVNLLHIRDILRDLLPEVGLSMDAFQFDYDAAAAAYLAKRPNGPVAARCEALFIDEAQDMGPDALKLLSALVRQKDDNDANSRSVNIFYDNAQNIYGRGTPTWTELGLDMRGRSTVMKESFRSTRPITEFALNVLYRLQPPATNPDHHELLRRGLIEQTTRNGADWWTVRFNQIDGPKPAFHKFLSLDMEMETIAHYCLNLIEVERVQPSDICIIYNGDYIRRRIERQIAPRLAQIGVELSVQTNIPFQRSSQMLLATTSHSYKGYDAEVVIIPAVDQFSANEVGILANNLYVAMTRARSILSMFGHQWEGEAANRIYAVIQACLGSLEQAPTTEACISPQDDFTDLLFILGDQHRKWLSDLWSRFPVSQEPLVTKQGEIIAEPLFTFQDDQGIHACFGPDAPPPHIANRLEDEGVKVLEVGQDV